MMPLRYEKINDYYLTDTQTGEKLNFTDALNRLNRTEILKKRCNKRTEAMVKILKEEITNAETDELRKSLKKVLNRRLDI